MPLGTDGAGRKPDAFEFVCFRGLRLAQSLPLLGLQEGDFLLLSLDEPLQFGDVTAVLGNGLLGRAGFGLDFSSGEAADFVFDGGKRVGHG